MRFDSGLIGGIIFGMLGFASGGWFGLIVGFLIGRWFGRSVSWSLGGQASASAVIEVCFELMGHISKVDGVVSQPEIDAAEAVMRRLQITGEARQEAVRAFNRGKTADYDVSAAAGRLRELCGGRVLWMRLALEIMLTSAMADGALTDSERRIVLQVAETLGFSPAELEQMLHLLGAGPRPGGRRGARPRATDELSECYAVLGVSSQAGDAEVKTAYRRLMSQHHPDKLAARDMPEAMRLQAEEQVRKIRHAWDTVKAARGL